MPLPIELLSSASSSAAASASAVSDEDCPHRRYVRDSDRRLAEVAAKTAARIPWAHLLLQQKKQPRASSLAAPSAFKPSTLRLPDSTVVTASRVVNCSPAEMRALLNPQSRTRYVDVMRELFGQDFVYGDVVHRSADSASSGLTVKTATFARRHALASNEQWCFVTAAQPLETLGYDEDEEEGFSIALASLQPDDVFIGKTQTDSVAQLQGLTAGYAVVPEPAAQFNLSNENTKPQRAVRVTFYAHVATAGATSKTHKLPRFLLSSKARAEGDDASSRSVLARATELARALRHLGGMVRRRRLGTQVLADLRHVQPRNTRCACCAHRLRSPKLVLGSKDGEKSDKDGPVRSHGAHKRKKDHRHAQQCHLCGFLVCARCVQTVEMSSAKTVHLCQNCMQRVDDGNYNNLCVDEGSLIDSSQHDGDKYDSNDYSGSNHGHTSNTASKWAAATSIKPDASGTESSRAALARVLDEMLVTASPDKKPAVLRVIQHLIDGDREQLQAEDSDGEDWRTSSALNLKMSDAGWRGSSTRGFQPSIGDWRTSSALNLKGSDRGWRSSMGVTISEADTRESLQLWSQASSVVTEEIELEDVPLAGASGRNYPLKFLPANENGSGGSVAQFPLPKNEEKRLQWLENHVDDFRDMTDLPELGLLCDVARRELGCDASMVTVVGATSTHVLACSDERWRKQEVSREQSFCSHTIMGEAPLLVSHPEADVRFSGMDVVQQGSLRFYMGFPLQIPSAGGGADVAVGSFCFVSADRSHEVTRKQYELMSTLSKGVVRVVRDRVSLSCASQT